MKSEVIYCFYLKGGVLETINSFELITAIAGLDLFRKKKDSDLSTNTCLPFKFHFSDILQSKSRGCCPVLDDRWVMNPKIIPISE